MKIFVLILALIVNSAIAAFVQSAESGCVDGQGHHIEPAYFAGFYYMPIMSKNACLNIASKLNTSVDQSPDSLSGMQLRFLAGNKDVRIIGELEGWNSKIHFTCTEIGKTLWSCFLAPANYPDSNVTCAAQVAEPLEGGASLHKWCCDGQVTPQYQLISATPTLPADVAEKWEKKMRDQYGVTEFCFQKYDV